MIRLPDEFSMGVTAGAGYKFKLKRHVFTEEYTGPIKSQFFLTPKLSM
jgi:hypothetical protein